MEAGGIEPPSRDGIQDASTCIVDHLFLGSVDAGRQAATFPSPTVFLPAHRQAEYAGQPAGVVGRISRRHPRDGLRVFTQPWHKCCQLVFRQVFYEAS